MLIPVRCKLDEDISSHPARLADPVWPINHLVSDRHADRLSNLFDDGIGVLYSAGVFRDAADPNVVPTRVLLKPVDAAVLSSPTFSSFLSRASRRLRISPLREDVMASFRTCTTAGSFRASFRLSLIRISCLDWSGSSEPAGSRTVLWSRLVVWTGRVQDSTMKPTSRLNRQDPGQYYEAD